MQLYKLIDDLKEFKKPDYLVEEFYEEFCNLNNREYDGHFEELVDFSFTTAGKHFENTLIHELIHAYDVCRVKKFDWKNCLHHACTEVRARR